MTYMLVPFLSTTNFIAAKRLQVYQCVSSSNNTQLRWESKPSAEPGRSTLISIIDGPDQDSQLL